MGFARWLRSLEFAQTPRTHQEAAPGRQEFHQQRGHGSGHAGAPVRDRQRNLLTGDVGWSLVGSKAGWWYTYSLEKYESVGITINNIWKNKKCSKPPTSHSKK